MLSNQHPSKGKIKKLDQLTINKIAAGEILQRPVNAVKELIENSHDANSTSIQVILEEGGLRNIQVCDNGDGIQLEDFELLCERFATSKISSFTDLTGGKVETFGFRGEALASISHVSRITITSKTDNLSCAFKAFYLNGQLAASPGSLSSQPKACAGNKGTIISIDDLFYNLPTRRKTFHHDEEYAKILELCQHYAIHWEGIGISCKRKGSCINESKRSVDLQIQQHSSTLERISSVFGGDLAKTLLFLSATNDELDASINGYISPLPLLSDKGMGLVGHSNSLRPAKSSMPKSKKRMEFLLFVNGRLVENSKMKKAISSLYDSHQHISRENHSNFIFVFIRLLLPFSSTDINVHPTKKEIYFLDEERIIEWIIREIQKVLLPSNSAFQNMHNSRTFNVPIVQSVNSFITGSIKNDLGGSSIIGNLEVSDISSHSIDVNQDCMPTTSSSSLSLPSPVYKLVRTDSQERKLSQFLAPSPLITNSQPINQDELSSLQNPLKRLKKRVTVDVQLDSIKRLKHIFCNPNSPRLDDGYSLRDSVFVGVIDERYGMFQKHTGLFLFEYKPFFYEYFYGELLNRFANYTDQIVLPISSAKIPDVLVECKEMLSEYFDIELVSSTGQYITVPSCLPQGMISTILVQDDKDELTNLADTFMNTIAVKINWEDENKCLEGLIINLALLHLQLILHTNHANFKETEHRIIVEKMFDVIKQQNPLFSSKRQQNEIVVRKLADIHDLYKVFERC